MSHEVKSLLKKVRDSLRENDHKTAYENSKVILEADEGNYHALVFLGVSAQELGLSDEAFSAFKKAVDLKPNDLLAWKGLLNFLEKNERFKKSQDLANTYEKIFNLLENEKAKQLEIAIKLAIFYKEQGEILKCAEVFQRQTKLVDDDEEKYKIWCQLINLFSFSSNPPSTLDSITLVDDAFQFVLKSKFIASDKQAHFIYKSYLLHLKYVKKCSTDEWAAESRRILTIFPNFNFALEVLCKIFAQTVITKEKANRPANEIGNLVAQLKAKECPLYLINLFSGIGQFLSGNYIEALKIFRQDVNADWLEINILIAKTQLKLHDYLGAERSVKLGLQKIKNPSQDQTPEMKSHFYVALGRALLGQRLFDYALRAFKKSEDLVGKTGEVVENEIKTYIAMNSLDEADKLLKENCKALNEDTCYYLEGELFFCRKNYETAKEKFLKCLEFKECSPIYHKVGVVKWELGDFSDAVSYFLKDVKLDPFYGRNYLYLGHFYKHINDTRKALQCYKKAYELNVNDDDSGKAYSDILLESNDKEANLQLLKSMIEKHGLNSPKWLWLRLGVIQLQMTDYISAIASLQNALQLDYTDVHCWECLGDAYLQQGSYAAAYKAFAKVSSLQPDTIFSLFRMASIKQGLGYFEDAIIEYQKILTMKPDHVPSLKGLAETLLLQAKKYEEEFLFDLAKDYSLQAVHVLSKICINQNQLSCLWKLIGDACHIISKMGNHHFPIAFPGNLIDPVEDQENKLMGKGDILAFCTRCYLKALSINNSVSGYWHDLGVSYLSQSEWSSEASQKKSFGQKALLCLQHSITLEPNNHEHWTALGVIAILTDQNYALAQHAFIKSIMVDSNDSNAWSNLGILYLLSQNIKLTHDALSKAQSLEPANHIPWIGQALVAETIGHYETLDLFRHATVLGNHREGSLGYAHWICKLLQDKNLEKTATYSYNVYKTFALPAAADGLIKYTTNDQTCKVSFFLLADLLERMELNRMALSAANHAVCLQKNGSERDLVIQRFARLLRKLGRQKEALEQLQSITSSDIGNLCELALILFLNGDFNKAYQAYTEVSKVTSNEEVISHVLVAMAMIARKLNDTQNAKTLLFQSFKKKPPSVYGFMALCALGLLENDPPLVMAAVNELQPYKKYPEYCVDVTHLLSCQYAQEGDVIGNLRQFSKAIHDQPNVAELWMSMAQAILMWQPWKTKYAVNCATVATYHGKQLGGISLLVTLCHLLAGNNNNSLKLAQKSVHMHPDNASCWSTLLSSLIAINPENLLLPKLFEVAKILALPQSKLFSWIQIIEVYMYLSKGERICASNLLKPILLNPTENENVLPAAHLLVVLTEGVTNTSLLSSVVQQYPNFAFGWMALVRLKIIQKQFDEAEIRIRRWLQVMGTLKLTNYFKMMPLLLMALLALEASKKTNNKEKWLTLSHEAVTEVLKLDATCQAALFVRALTGLMKGNNKLAIPSLKRIVSQSSARGEDKWIEKLARKELLQVYTSKDDLAGVTMLLERAEEKNDQELIVKLKTFCSKQQKKDDS